MKNTFVICLCETMWGQNKGWNGEKWPLAKREKMLYNIYNI